MSPMFHFRDATTILPLATAVFMKRVAKFVFLSHIRHNFRIVELRIKFITIPLSTSSMIEFHHHFSSSISSIVRSLIVHKLVQLYDNGTRTIRMQIALGTIPHFKSHNAFFHARLSSRTVGRIEIETGCPRREFEREAV